MYFPAKFRSLANPQRRLKPLVLQLEQLEDRLQLSSVLLGDDLVANLAPDPAFIAASEDKAQIHLLSTVGEEHATLSAVAAASVSAAGSQTGYYGAVAQPAMPSQPSGQNSAAPVANASLGAAAFSASSTTVSQSRGAHQLRELQVTVQLGSAQVQLSPAANHSVPQQIHPDASLNWATYVTQTATVATGQAVVVDSNGNVYVTGATDESAVKQAFVAEYDSNGNRIFYTTFQAVDVGANGSDAVNYTHSEGTGIALDGNGNIYVVGTATEPSARVQDAFIMRFNSSGKVDSTYGVGFNSRTVTGTGLNVSGNGIVVAPDGTATITGTGSFQELTTLSTHQSVFLAQINPQGIVASLPDGTPYAFGIKPAGFGNGSQGNQLFTSTFGNAIALSPDGSTGYLSGTGSATGGNSDSMVLSFNLAAPVTGNMIQGYTLSGSGEVVGSNDGPVTGGGIAVGADGTVYQGGTTSYQENGLTSTYAFAVSWMADLSASIDQGLDDGTPSITGTGIAVDPAGNIYLTGTASDQNGVQRALVDALQSAGSGQLQIADTQLVAESGSGQEAGWGIAYSNASNTVYVTGDTTSSNLSTDVTSLNGHQDAFLANVGNFMT